MNLVTGEWIPVLCEAGDHRLVSLDTLYRDAEQIRDLCATPPQRIALMRLLICITQAALDGPQDEGDWQACRSQVVPKSIEYLQAHKDEFDLYGDRPFLQVKALKTTNNAVLDKLDFGLASGHNSVLFDHQAGPEGRPQSPGWVALMLLTYQAFSPTGTIGVTEWSGITTSPNSEHAPCVEGSALHTLVRGKTLLDSVRMNLLTKRCIQELTSLPWGQPIWEVEPRSSGEKTLKDLTRTYLGRLVPLSRAILVDPMEGKATLVNGLAYPKLPESREPSATVMLRKRKTVEKHAYLRADPAKHPWRELGSLLCFSRRDQPGGALALQHLDPNRGTLVDIWTGGLVADQGKIVDVAEWTFSIPQSTLETSTLNRYEEGAALASMAERALGKAVSAYCAAMKSESTRGAQARTHFWGTLDSSYSILLQIANSKGTGLADTWYPVVRKAMERAYESTCPHETPRQIQAFVQGVQALRLKKPGQ